MWCTPEPDPKSQSARRAQRSLAIRLPNELNSIVLATLARPHLQLHSRRSCSCLMPTRTAVGVWGGRIDFRRCSSFWHGLHCIYLYISIIHPHGCAPHSITMLQTLRVVRWYGTREIGRTEQAWSYLPKSALFLNVHVIDSSSSFTFADLSHCIRRLSY